MSDRYRYNFEEVKAAARGRSLEILKHFRPDFPWEEAWKHTWCPRHGGVNGDAFRLLDGSKRGFPSFADFPMMICNSCHGKDPVKGIIDCLMWAVPIASEYDALVQLAEYLGFNDPARRTKPPPVLPKRTFHPPKPTRNPYNAQKLKDAWKQSLSISDPVAFNTIKQYLVSRGLQADPSPVHRLHPNMEYLVKDRYDPKTKQWHYRSLGSFPAILSLYVTPDGRPMNIHRTYLDPNTGGKLELYDQGRKMPAKKNMSPVIQGYTNYCAIRLFEPINGVIGVSEGIENCYAVNEALGLPMWAMGDANGLQEGRFPPEVHTILVFGDLDVPDKRGIARGDEAASALVQRLLSEGRVSRKFLPDYDLSGRSKGVDWLNVLNWEGPKGFPDISQYFKVA